MAFGDWLRQMRSYDRVAGIGAIARRYLAMNAFDGVVTIIGVITGSYAAGVSSGHTVVVTGASTAVAMSVGGVWGAWLSESAERKRDVEKLERHMITDLGQSRIGRASRAAVVVVVLVEAITPLIAATPAVLPFLFASHLPDIRWAYGLGVLMALLTLAAVGIFLGRISKQGLVGFTLKTVLAGMVALGLGLLLPGPTP